MLPLSASPSTHNKRIAEWVQRSSAVNENKNGSRRQSPRLSMKRALTNDENSTPLVKQSSDGARNEPVNKKAKVVVKDHHDKVIEPPSTPESQSSINQQQNYGYSPGSQHWMRELSVRRRGNQTNKPMISDSESAQSTPVKAPQRPSQDTHKISCGLDTSDSEEKSKQMNSGKKFFLSGERRSGKTPLDYYKQAMKQNRRRVKNSSDKKVRRGLQGEISTAHKLTSTVQFSMKNDVNLYKEATTPTTSGTTPTRKTTPTKETTPTSETTPADARVERDDTQSYNDHGQITPASSEHTTPEIKTDDLLDKNNTTLSVEQKDKVRLPLFKQTAAVPNRAEEKEQMIIDAGAQDMDAAYQCPVCRMIYTRKDPTDEACHKQFHGQLITALKFTGWKKENIVEEGGDYRVLSITNNSQAHEMKKVQALKVILDQELGFVQESTILVPGRKVYIYISEKQIRGVAIAEPIHEASRLVGETASQCTCRASIGINRLWVSAQSRRQGVATKLLDAIRSTFATGLCVSRSELAFSDPTIYGKRFAEKYADTTQFLVYKP